jgi:predicted sulfurtransferase
MRFLEISKHSEIIMVCRSGDRSLRATYFLMNNGYPNVSNMSGGIVKWVNKGFSTIGNTNSVLENQQLNDCCGNVADVSGETCC